MRMFVVGFMFNSTRDRVLLMFKTHPEWQKGRLNGLGGKVEDGESPVQCMVREFREECGLETAVQDWEHVAVISGTVAHDDAKRSRGEFEPWTVHYFRATGPIKDARSTSDEMVEVMPVEAVSHYPALTSLRWLLPLCQQSVFPFIKPIIAVEQ